MTTDIKLLKKAIAYLQVEPFATGERDSQECPTVTTEDLQDTVQYNINHNENLVNVQEIKACL